MWQRRASPARQLKRRSSAQRAASEGTRVRLFPQPPVVAEFAQPETVWLSIAPAALGPGPSDDRMYVASAVAKPRPYEFPYLPPYTGPVHAPATAGADGHFDHLPVDSREFRAVHMYGTLRLVLDIWERYFGRRIDWHFATELPRMELIPWLDWNNAQSGWGFIETGYRRTQHGERVPLSLNFDVLAHEMGHAILYSLLGWPPRGRLTAEYQGFHESASDLIAIVSVLHFDSVVDLLLRRTHGNLYVRNLLNRIGEISPTEQIRLASNRLRMRDVPDVHTPPDRLTQPQLHRIGEPLTGTVFDILVEVYQQNLVDTGLITPELDLRSGREAAAGVDDSAAQAGFDRAYDADPQGFKQALLDARDYLGRLLAQAWSELAWDLSFVDAGRALLRADLELSGGYFQPEMLESLVWREIGGH